MDTARGLKETKTLYHSIDRKELNDQKIVLIGWGLSKTGVPVQIAIRNSNGESVSMEYKKMLRPDASMTMLGDESQKECGFRISFVYHKKEHYVLEIKDAQEAWRMRIDPVRLEKQQRKEENRHYQPLGRILKHLSKTQIRQDVSLLIKKGFGALRREWFVRYALPNYQYEKWYAEHQIDEKEREMQRKKVFPYMPKVSIIVPTYLTPELFLRQMIDSVKEQTYSNWELCIADGGVNDLIVEKVVTEYQTKDQRICYQKLEENKQISGNSNEALKLATGEYIALLDHDDLLAPNTLYEVVKAINEESADVIYSDEDKVSMDLKHHFEPHFKPDLNIDLLRSNNYICHLFVAKTEYIKETGGFRSAFDGAQDFDLIFRCVEKAEKVYHIPKILYHWRMHQNSTAANPESKMYCYEAGLHAIEEHLQRVGVEGKVSMLDHLGYYRVEYPVKGNSLVSIVIWGKNKELAKKTLASIEEYAGRIMYEIIFKEAINTEQCNGDYILFLKAGTLLISEMTLSRWLGECERVEVGAVGAKVYDVSNRILHCGQIIDRNGECKALFRGAPKGEIGYFTRAKVQQNLSAISYDAAMVKKSFLQRNNCGKIVLDPGLELNYIGHYDETDFSDDFTTILSYQAENITADPNYNLNLNDVQGNFRIVFE